MWTSLFQTSPPRVLQVLLDAVLPESQISRRRAPIWNDSLAIAEECARLFKTSFTLKEVDKKYQALRFTTLFSNGLPWFSSFFFLKAPGYEQVTFPTMRVVSSISVNSRLSLLLLTPLFRICMRIRKGLFVTSQRPSAPPPAFPAPYLYPSVAAALKCTTKHQC